MSSLLNKVADLYTDPVLAIWSFLSLPATGLLFLITYPDPISSFYLFLLILTLSWLVVAPTAFKDTSHASVDWTEEVDYRKVVGYTFIGLVGLLIIGTIISIVFLGEITPAIWVPSQLIPLTLGLAGPTLLISNLFSTTFSVVPGEESLKALFTVLFRSYQKSWWAEKLPFALQPAILVGVTVWALEHVVKGQYPCSAQSGSYLTSWLIHLGYNSLVLLMG